METPIPSKGITETGRKWIALVTMVLDHIHYFFSFTGQIPEWFSMVGRLGAPLFLFCLVEGFTHTHSRRRYFAKVYIISTFMSALLFLMAYGGVLAFLAAGLKKRLPLENCLLLVAVLGGFLFSVLWEAKARYIFPYFILMLPCTAAGIAAAAAAFRRRGGKQAA